MNSLVFQLSIKISLKISPFSIISMEEEIISNKPITVKKGHMYYIDAKGFAHEAIPGDEISDKRLTDIPPVRKQKGYMYYVNLKGYICRRKPIKGR